ncbi:MULTISPECIES: hypothetical protein [unclassified Crossiella]|uniref:hypothetical protein n=1 Tax=unclassified Crossiella TaxID=2620835 RepID=UPI0020000D70|nr:MULTISPECIES: hypothetical protein [unclassified Crossiella]MCK2242627.1 hypothetical protein [Crossiella sp. S99.2]MCK2256504.1 hypothetical protein [Crossiella sp. S99.1]
MTQTLLDSRVAPTSVRYSAALWLAAVGAGVAETVLGVLEHQPTVDEAVVPVGIRVVVTAILVPLILAFRRGRGWARVALALLLGVAGTLSLVVEPISWLAAGNDPVALFAGADAGFLVFAVVRALHIAAVFGALVLMFTPSANGWFRRR